VHNSYKEHYGPVAADNITNPSEEKRYTVAFRITTTHETDVKMQHAAAQEARGNYALLTHDCTDVAEEALKAGGLNEAPEIHSVPPYATKTDARGLFPTSYFGWIQKNNPGSNEPVPQNPAKPEAESHLGHK
jgi:hypothetical protein